MNDAKYMGLDVHQATIWVAALDSAGQLAMEAILEDGKAERISVYSWPARKFACDPGGRNLRGVFARPAQAAGRCSSAV